MNRILTPLSFFSTLQFSFFFSGCCYNSFQFDSRTRLFTSKILYGNVFASRGLDQFQYVDKKRTFNVLFWTYANTLHSLSRSVHRMCFGVSVSLCVCRFSCVFDINSIRLLSYPTKSNVFHNGRVLFFLVSIWLHCANQSGITFSSFYG